MRTIDRELRKRFPDNAGRRCMYGAFALAHLLRDATFEATVIGGDFAIFVPTRDGKSAAFHGFGGSTKLGTTSHYWVESEGRLLDASTLLLHTTTLQNIVRLPVVYWPVSKSLPRYIRYDKKMRAYAGAEFSTIPEQRETATAVVEECRRRMKVGSRTVTTKLEVLDGPEFVFRARARNSWAKAAADFETNTRYGPPPF